MKAIDTTVNPKALAIANTSLVLALFDSLSSAKILSNGQIRAIIQTAISGLSDYQEFTDGDTAIHFLEEMLGRWPTKN